MTELHNTVPEEGSESAPTIPKPNKSFRLLKRCSSFLAFGFIACFLVSGCFLLYLRGQALPVTYIPQTSQIIDINGKVIDEYYSGQNRQLVPLEEISPYLVQATLAIEDQRFFDHFGLDVKGLTRAALVNLQHMDKVQGASTITQQLARNLYLNHEKSWTRKFKEAMYSLQLEMKYSKEEILEMYLNEVYYGHSLYGVQTAAQAYYGKDASELSLAESALLAGVPKGPAYYSPYLNKENAIERQHVILQKMVDLGYITKQEQQQALDEQLEFKPLEGPKPSLAPYFRDYVRSIAVDELGLDEKMFDEGGIKVYTTLDLSMQAAAEEVVAKYMDGAEPQAALVAIDPRNGYIKAMIGGRKYEESTYNRALSGSRQPGSAFKPFVYLTALQHNDFTATHTYKSEPTAFTYDNGKKTYMPSNFANKYPNKEIDLRYAIAHSDNIYAVHTIMDVGAEEVVKTAQALGISSKLRALPSLALGTSPVSPLEMASAYGTIANQGVRMKPIAILKIVDAQGNVLYEAETTHEQVVAPEHAYVLTYLMESVFENGGTGSRVAHLMKRPVAAKTGTTDSDAWMVGFTPELATAVWVGHDKGRVISSAESTLAAPIFAEFTEKALEAIPPKLFPIPENVVHVYIDPESGLLATPDCPDARLEAFVRGTEPSEYCTAHSPEPPAEDPEVTDESQKQRSWLEDLKRWWND
ncbi:transglycosylase domain-containing protein [Marinicrinis lubricantis]|uniref:Transglycosylase domain-containing protein n=1 Tax=Marinicrinis lubricantis TaxID=2086470 RepID=A0ABW1IW90_9BACL